MAKISARGAYEIARWEKERTLEDLTRAKDIIVLTSDGRVLGKTVFYPLRGRSRSTNYRQLGHSTFARMKAWAKKAGFTLVSSTGEEVASPEERAALRKSAREAAARREALGRKRQEYLAAARDLLPVSATISYRKGERAKWVARELVKKFPELKGYENRLYDWALQTLTTYSDVRFPVP